MAPSAFFIDGAVVQVLYEGTNLLFSIETLIDTSNFGVASGGSTSTSSYNGRQTSKIVAPTDLRIQQIRWSVHNDGDFEVYFDDVLVSSKSVVTGEAIVFDAAAGDTPIEVTRGVHEVSLRRTSGSNGWKYVGEEGYTDGLWNYAYWQEATGGERPLVAVTVDHAPYQVVDFPGGASIAGSSQIVEWEQTFLQDTDVYALQFRVDAGTAAADLWVDGVKKATSVERMNPNHCLIPDEPLFFAADTPHRMQIISSTGDTTLSDCYYMSADGPWSTPYQRVDAWPGSTNPQEWCPRWITAPIQ